MKAVVDTNVIAYYLLGTEPYSVECRQFWSLVSEPIAPAIWEAELTNVLWMAVRGGVLRADVGVRQLELAARLGVRSVSNRSLWRGALTRAVASDAAAYDTLFVELAVRERCPLATFDRKFLKLFPEVAKRPAMVVSG